MPANRCPWCDSPSHVADAPGGCPGWRWSATRKLPGDRLEFIIAPKAPGAPYVRVVLMTGPKAAAEYRDGRLPILERATMSESPI